MLELTAEDHQRFRSTLETEPSPEAADFYASFPLAAELRWVRILHQLMHMQIDIRRAQQHPIGPTGNSHEVPQNIPA